MINKKGISPLIATVLIIGFTIVAAVLVITWINGLIGSQTSEQACRSAALSECIDTSGDLTYSYSGTIGSDLKAEVLNSGSTEVNITVVYLDSNSATIGSCPITSISVPAYSSGTTSTACSDAGVAKIKFVQVVTALENGVSCEETCGEGKIVEVV